MLGAFVPFTRSEQCPSKCPPGVDDSELGVGCLFARGVDRGGVGNNRGGMDDRVGNGNRGGNRGEGSSAVVGDLGDISVDGIGVVVHVLDPAVGKGDRIAPLSVSCTIA